MAQTFKSLPAVPDHAALEREILAWWDAQGSFDRLREQNRGGDRWSFIDGPITANNPMGVHHAWGRTLKDVFQRYKALRGFDQRYQNGFDCQGLWVEVEVEKSLGLNSKRDIEELRARGVRRALQGARGRVRGGDHGAVEAPRHVDGLGQRLPHFLRHEHLVHLGFPEGRPRARLALHGAPATEWCPRCGTSISQHELFAGEYKELEHPSLYVRFR
jgi:isoleucyl-tRNA synthetase